MDIFESAFCGKINHFFGRFGRKPRYTHYFSRLDPRGVFYPARVVEIQDNIVVSQQIRRTPGNHHEPPGSCKWSKVLNVVVHFAADDVFLSFPYEKFGPAIIYHLAFTQCGIKAVRELQR